MSDRYLGKFAGVVVDNDDPDGLCRIDVSVPANTQTPGRVAAAGFFDEAWQLQPEDGRAAVRFLIDIDLFAAIRVPSLPIIPGERCVRAEKGAIMRGTLVAGVLLSLAGCMTPKNPSANLGPMELTPDVGVMKAEVLRRVSVGMPADEINEVLETVLVRPDPVPVTA